MLEKPDLADATLTACLRDAYGLTVQTLEFLPLGADRNTAVYRAICADYDAFVKLRREDFNAACVELPCWLAVRGVDAVIAPKTNHHGALWTPLAGFHLMVYPFVEGQNGFERPLSAGSWCELGRVLAQIHEHVPPSEIIQGIPREAFSGHWRLGVRGFQRRVEDDTFADPIAVELARFMREQAALISALVGHAERLAQVVQRRDLPSVLCHGDIHVGNVLLTANGTLFVVDWDTIVMAPKERDLMFFGMGMASAAQYNADQQAELCFEGYGETPVDRAALAYYRCERIVQDVFAYCEQILLVQGDRADRLEGLRQLQGQFGPGEVVARALQAVEVASCEFDD